MAKESVAPRHPGEVDPSTFKWYQKPWFGIIKMPRDRSADKWRRRDEIKARLYAMWTVMMGQPMVYHCMLEWPPQQPDSNRERNYPTAYIDCQFVKQQPRMFHGNNPTALWN